MLELNFTLWNLRSLISLLILLHFRAAVERAAPNDHWLVLLGNIEFELELLLAVIGILVYGVADRLV